VKLSIIVPILNEAPQLPELFEHLLPMQLAGCEIIFADGGSDDGSATMVNVAGYHVVNAERGRARQMNAAAAVATGEALLFLHADTRLPEKAVHDITQSLSRGKHCWGRFDVCITGRSFMLSVIGRMMNWRSRLTGIATGDQAMFMQRAAFEQLQGFPDQPLMEDVELSKRLKTLSHPACLGQCVITSGRRWETRGVWQTIFLMWRLRWQYWLGTDATHLVRLYR
jgi:rSAM/selenodomain-associated transferase 2